MASIEHECRACGSVFQMTAKPKKLLTFYDLWMIQHEHMDCIHLASPNPPGPTPTVPFWECERCREKFTIDPTDEQERMSWKDILKIADFHELNHPYLGLASD